MSSAVLLNHFYLAPLQAATQRGLSLTNEGEESMNAK